MHSSHSQPLLGSQQVANATKARDSESLKEVAFSILFYFQEITSLRGKINFYVDFLQIPVLITIHFYCLRFYYDINLETTG